MNSATNLPVSIETLKQRVIRSYSSCSNRVFVIVTESSHWNPQGQRWLAMHVCRYIRQFLEGAIIYAVGASGEWEHEDISHISFDEYTQISQEQDLVVLSCSHNCPRCEGIKILARHWIDLTAYAIDSPKVDYDYSDKDIQEIAFMHSMLCDNESRLELIKVLCARISGDLSMLSAAPFRIYNYPMLFDSGYPEGLYIDAGAYDGSEANWLRSILPSNSEVIAFEMDPKNYSEHLSSKSDELITYVNAGLWSSNTNTTISGGGVGARVSISQIADPTENTARLYSLDSFHAENYPDQRVAFIKMDIEGAEQDALIGAQTILRIHKPKLAISIYHQPSDLWRIAHLIMSFNDSYKLHFAQHAPLLTETVLYAH